MATSRHPFHSMCSYLGSFPPKVPERLLRKYFDPGQRVLDPFCGSGTTLDEAKRLGHPSVGIDLNPLALALARAKVQRVTLGDVNDRLTEIASSYSGRENPADAPDNIQMLFHPRTLSQMLHLRRELRDDVPEDVFIRGLALGIMHGKFRKPRKDDANGRSGKSGKGDDTAYLSIDMPNTFSMSAAYVRGFVEKHNLQQPLVDTFVQLRKRAEWLLRERSLPTRAESMILAGDATNLPGLLEQAGSPPVDGIITSPPYLGVLRYGAFNWIRLWFLGYEQGVVDRLLDSTDSLDRYLSFMSNFLNAAGQVLPAGAPVALVIGDVVEFGVHLHLADRVWEELRDLVPFDWVGCSLDQWDESGKTTRIWGEERKGRATPLDRILVMRRRSKKRKKGAALQTGSRPRVLTG